MQLEKGDVLIRVLVEHLSNNARNNIHSELYQHIINELQKENITPNDVVQIDVQPMHDYENKETIFRCTVNFKK